MNYFHNFQKTFLSRKCIFYSHHVALLLFCSFLEGALALPLAILSENRLEIRSVRSKNSEVAEILLEKSESMVNPRKKCDTTLS